MLANYERGGAADVMGGDGGGGRKIAVAKETKPLAQIYRSVTGPT
jgi:hypothetical protein